MRGLKREDMRRKDAKSKLRPKGRGQRAPKGERAKGGKGPTKMAKDGRQKAEERRA
jgi:hypothetical protein